MREFPSILLSDSSVSSGEAANIVNSNISVINVLRNAEVGDNELHPDAFASYIVDYYYTILQDEGLPAFIWKTKWDSDIIEIVQAGLTAMQATEHLTYFEKQMRRVNGFSKIKLAKFFQAALGKDKANEALLDDKTHTAIQEDLIALNAAWLQSHPDVQILPIEELQEEIEDFLADDTTEA